MDCKFQKIGDGVLVCPVCQRRHFTHESPELCSRKCGPGKDTGTIGGIRLNLKIPPRPKTAEQKDKEAAALLDWPSLVESTKKFIISMGSAVNATAKGQQVLVTVDQYNERTATCDACPFRDKTRCKICTCKLAAKAKLVTDHCPLGKWSGDPGVDAEFCRKRHVPEEVIQRHQKNWEARQ